MAYGRLYIKYTDGEKTLCHYYGDSVCQPVIGGYNDVLYLVINSDRIMCKGVCIGYIKDNFLYPADGGALWQAKFENGCVYNRSNSIIANYT